MVEMYLTAQEMEFLELIHRMERDKEYRQRVRESLKEADPEVREILDKVISDLNVFPDEMPQEELEKKFQDHIRDERERRRKEIQDHIKRSNIPNDIKTRYDVSLGDLRAILKADDLCGALCLAYDYGFSRGWRAAKNVTK